jgi:Domain of unknown function (DUF4328)
VPVPLVSDARRSLNRTILDVTDAYSARAAQADVGWTVPTFVAHALTGLLAADIVGAAARLAVPPLLSGSEMAFQVQIDVKPIVILSRIALVATVVVFLFWFSEARVNAELSDWRQRRARPWAFWGWIIPIADLWIPFQIMGDIWRAHLPPQRRDKVAWLPVVWWTSWLLTGLLSHPTVASSGGGGDGLQLARNWVTFCFFAVSGVTLIAIIQAVSARSTPQATLP